MNKVILLDTLISNHTRFEAILALVSKEKMQAPFEDGSQAGKDIVAHVTVWQQRLVNWFAIVAQGGIPYSPEPGLTWKDMDQLNAQTELRYKDHPLEEVMKDFQRTFQEFLALIQGFSEEALNASYPFAWGELKPREEKRPLWVSALAGPGYAHYQDHFIDLLQRINPAQRFTPDPEALKAYIGTYALPPQPPFTFSVEDGRLLLERGGKTFSCLALDETRFAFDGVGLITFYPAPNGMIPTLEWWVWLFMRVNKA